MHKTILKGITILGLAALAGCGSVESGEAGFFTQWGEIVSRSCLEEGLHFFPAFGKDLVVYNIRNQIIKVRTTVYTRDTQTIDPIEMTVTYHLNRDSVIDLHRNTGRDYAKILIEPAVLGATKDALGKMDAADIVANREKATQSIHDAISSKLTTHGIIVTMVNLTNLEYSPAFEKAVEEKQVALQKAIKEKNETARLREVAEQQVVKADADARSRVLEAEAEAKAILVKSEAEAKSIQMRNEALAASRALIDYEMVKAWDGKLPVQMLGNSPVPFLNIQKFETDKEN